MPLSIRLAHADDAAGCLEIYRPAVLTGAISFEITVPDLTEMEARIAGTLAAHPWLVSDDAGGVTGYAYAGPHRSRGAYQWCAEVSVYVREDARRRGLASALYTAVFQCLRHQGYYNAYAGVTLPNPASVAFHESMGFIPVGVYRAIGYKFDRWHDVGWWSLRLGYGDAPPTPPIPLAACRDELAALLGGGA